MMGVEWPTSGLPDPHEGARMTSSDMIASESDPPSSASASRCTDMEVSTEWNLSHDQ
jgi:hypothetical protein